jgi:hypothetical protein
MSTGVDVLVVVLSIRHVTRTLPTKKNTGASMSTSLGRRSELLVERQR